MSRLPFILLLTVCSSCSMQSNGVKDAELTGLQKKSAKELFAIMKIKDTINMGDPVELTFTIYNHTDSVKRVLKWQTPFEPLMSKYLDVQNDQEQEAIYSGPMAKRMMPPPASAYLTLEPMDSLVAKIDILKGYTLEKPGKYTITYTSEEMNGVKVLQPVSFVYK